MPNSRQRQIRKRIIDRDYPELWSVFRSNPNAREINNFLADQLLSSRPTVDPVIELPLKHIRLQQLADARLNITNTQHYLRGELSLDKNLNALKDFLRVHRRLSVRTYREEKYGEPSPRLPVLYDTGRWSVIRDFAKENNMDNHTLVHQAISLEDTVYSCNLVLCDQETFLVSVLEGRGTPRFVDEKDVEIQVYMGQFSNPLPTWMPPFITNVANSLRNFLPEIRPMTIEVSIYPYEVGQLKKHYVLWEYRGGVEQDIKVMVAHCLKQSRSFEATIRFPGRGDRRSCYDISNRIRIREGNHNHDVLQPIVKND